MTVLSRIYGALLGWLSITRRWFSTAPAGTQHPNSAPLSHVLSVRTALGGSEEQPSTQEAPLSCILRYKHPREVK